MTCISRAFHNELTRMNSNSLMNDLFFMHGTAHPVYFTDLDLHGWLATTNQCVLLVWPETQYALLFVLFGQTFPNAGLLFKFATHWIMLGLLSIFSSYMISDMYGTFGSFAHSAVHKCKAS